MRVQRINRSEPKCIRGPGTARALGLLALLLGNLVSAQSLSVGKATFDPLFCSGFDPQMDCDLPLGADKLVFLEQLSPLPRLSGGPLPIQFRAGWPLIFRASVRADDMLGIGRIYGEQGFEIQGLAFAEVGQGAAIVFENPDGNWSFSIPSQLPNDERVLDFHPDPGDVTGVSDDAPSGPMSHHPATRFNLRPEFGGPLPRQAPDGSMVQVVVEDGVQFGADDDFPGLVILSNVGVGIVMSNLAQGWTPVSPRQSRNLAGLMNSVGYELSDAQSRTSITASMIVPRFLFSRIRVHDLCVGAALLNGDGEPVSCTEGPIQRVDGGPSMPLQPVQSTDESIVELRAFVIEPFWNSVSNRLEYLDTVTDMDGDGQVTANDAAAMGSRVLSNEIVFNFRQIGSNVSTGQITQYNAFSYCNGLARPANLREAGADFHFDIDANSYAILSDTVICPGGGSGVSQPPR